MPSPANHRNHARLALRAGWIVAATIIIRSWSAVAQAQGQTVEAEAPREEEALRATLSTYWQDSEVSRIYEYWLQNVQPGATMPSIAPAGPATAWNTSVLATLLREGEVPAIEEFPPGGLTWGSTDPASEVAALVASRLSRLGIPSHNLVRDDALYLVTWFVPEARRAGERIERRTAYLLRIGPGNNNDQCTAVSLSWIRQQRGVRETPWSVSAGTSAAPALAQPIAGWFPSASACL